MLLIKESGMNISISEIKEMQKTKLKFAQDGYAIFSEEQYDKSKNKKVFNKLGKNKAKYRYFYKETLKKDSGKNLLFILYNPSKADENKDDPTIANCRKLAEDKKFSSFCVVNIFPERNPSVDEINKNCNCIEYINECIKANTDIVLAWGEANEKKCREQLANLKIIEGKHYYYIVPENGNKIKNYHPSNRSWNRWYKGFKNAKLFEISAFNIK
jgi:hypothetical protein